MAGLAVVKQPQEGFEHIAILGGYGAECLPFLVLAFSARARAMIRTLAFLSRARGRP